MKNINSAILLIFLAVTAVAQNSTPFVSEKGKFQINFESTPTIETTAVTTDVGDIEMTTFIYEEGANIAYMVAFNDYPDDLINNSEPMNLLSGAKDGVVNSMGITEFKSEKDITKDGYKGMSFKGSSDQYYVQYEMYVVKNRLYQIGYISSKEYPSKKIVKSFFKTFELLD